MPDFARPVTLAPVASPSCLSKPELGAVEAAPLERTSLQLYLQEIAQTPPVTIAEEVTPARRIRQGDRAVRDHMIKACLRLVVFRGFLASQAGKKSGRN